MKKTIKTLLTALLLVAMLLTALVGCNPADNDSDDDGASSGYDITGYSVVRPDLANTKLISNVATFKKLLTEYTGAELDVLIDAESTPAEKEILIGQTSRPESQSALTELADESDDGAYIIRETNGKIVILGKTEAATLRAMKYFLMTYAKDSADENTLKLNAGHNETGIARLDSYFHDETFTELTVEVESDVSVPTGSVYYWYETMIELNYQPDEKNNGTLLASHATTDGFYRILKSTDGGQTWTKIANVTDNYNSKGNSITCNLQPCLFELPADVGTFKKGTLILSTCTNISTRTGEEKSALVVYYSTDQGVTWNAYMNLAEGGSADSQTGVWETFFIYEEERGRVYAFFSDERDPKAGPHAQRLVYRYTTDMINWSEVKDAVNGNEPNYRPGMISIAKMNNGEYIMTYEICGTDEYKYCIVCYKKTKDLDDWGDITDYGTVIKSVGGATFGSAPWCAYTPNAGENGMLIVAGCGMNNGTATNGKNNLFLSFDYGETFIEIPDYIALTKTTKSGYSPYLGFSLDGGTLYYLNNPNSKVSFVKVKVW